ncbi:MAG: hypothetical protein WCR74_07105, partial [Betaproteobacteria bacterium]
VGGLIGGVGYKISTDMLESAADVLTERISRETLGEMQRLGLLREALGDSTALSSISFLCDG